MQTKERPLAAGDGRTFYPQRLPRPTQGNGPGRDRPSAPPREARPLGAGYAQQEEAPDENGYRRPERPWGNAPTANRFEQAAAKRIPAPAPLPLARPELRAVYEARMQHITATVWERSGHTGWAAYTVTLTRTFYSERRGQYLTTTQLFAEDVALALEALADAYAWLRQQVGDPVPF